MICGAEAKRMDVGVFFLFGQGRLRLCRSQPELALEYYQRAMEVQNQYRNLHHVSFWEMAISNFALWDIVPSLECWRSLAAEATVRICIYSHGASSLIVNKLVVKSDVYIRYGGMLVRAWGREKLAGGCEIDGQSTWAAATHCWEIHSS